MDKKLTGYDVALLNQHIASSDQAVSQQAREKLKQYVNQADCFADTTAEDWARKIYVRISKPDFH